jgi:quercetin dioxygenase-like cupin family protein
MDKTDKLNNNENFSGIDGVSTAYFTGPVEINVLMPNEEIYNCPVYKVNFEPGVHSNWHNHPGGQIWIVTSGNGYYQEKGSPVKLIKEGDIVKITPNVEHWHGATKDSNFSHIAISTNIQKGDAVWLGKVTDEEYNSYRLGN